jgi:Domain of unknown function (DUF4328)
MDNPYAVMPSQQQDQLGPPPLPPPLAYRPAGGLAMASVILLGVQVALNGMTSIAYVMAANSLSSSGSLGDSGLGPLIVVGSLGVISTLAFIATVIVYLIWLHRAYTNLRALDSGFIGKFTPGWAVGWWFIPFANLVMPYQAMSELYVNSVSAPANAAGYSARPSAGIIGGWWAAFILRGLFSYVGQSAHTLSDLESTMYANAVSCVIAMLAGILCMVIVRRIERGQTQRATRAVAAA